MRVAYSSGDIRIVPSAEFIASSLSDAAYHAEVVIITEFEKNGDLLRNCAVSSGKFLLTFRNKLSVPKRR